MKNKIFTLTDFEIEKIDTKTQKLIKGGGNDATDPSTPSYPLKTNGGGNG